MSDIHRNECPTLMRTNVRLRWNAQRLLALKNSSGIQSGIQRRIAIPYGQSGGRSPKTCQGERQFRSLRPVARILSACQRHNEMVRVLRCFMRLRSAVGVRGSGAESGEKRIAHRSRSATTAAEPQAEARRSWRPTRDLHSGTGVVERGTGSTESLCSVANRALVTAAY